MKSTTNSLTNYLTSNNTWIVIVTLTFIAFKWVLTFVLENQSPMIYLHYEKWYLFGKTVGAMLLIFSPTLVLTHFRPRLKAALNKLSYWVLSAIVLLVWPIVIPYTGITGNLMPVPMLGEVLAMIGIVLAIISVATEPSGWLVNKMSFNSLSRSITPTRIILSLLFLLSIYGTLQLKMRHGEESPFLLLWLQNILLMTLYYIFFKINHEYLIKKILKEKGVVYYLFSFLGLMMLFYIPVAVVYYFLPGFKTYLNYNLASDWVGQGQRAFLSIYSTTITSFMVLTIPLAILVEWFTQANKIDRLQGEKSETELNLLKQQINPHFFFNTLNNVYAMSLTNDKQTSKGILQLSDLMRYVIYKGQEETVSLGDELKYLEDFLDLQKLRLHKNLDFRFDKELENSETKLTPLLFIILVENAFKHGIEGAEGDSYLHLHLSQVGKQLVFRCENSVEIGKQKEEPGLGLTNLKRRLDLIYPNRHTLEIEHYADKYRAVLTIDL